MTSRKNSQTIIKFYFYAEVSFGKGDKFGEKYHWSKDLLDKKIKAALTKNWGEIGCAYGAGNAEILYKTINLYKDKVIGKRALVIGSVNPWVEAILIAIGAKHVTTLEYNQIDSNHPQVTLMNNYSLVFTYHFL